MYDGPVTLTQTGTQTLKAKAFKEYYEPSLVATAVYDLSWPAPDLVFVESGTFNNGTSNITLSGFFLGQYEVTQAEFQHVMGYNPSESHGLGDIYPVYAVSWFNAIEYCNLRSMQEGLISTSRSCPRPCPTRRTTPIWISRPCPKALIIL